MKNSKKLLSVLVVLMVIGSSVFMPLRAYAAVIDITNRLGNKTYDGQRYQFPIWHQEQYAYYWGTLDNGTPWGGSDNTTPPTDAGSYTVKVHYWGWPTVSSTYNDIGQGTFQIVKASGSGEVTIENWTYRGEPRDPQLMNNTNVGATVTWSYQGRGETKYGPSPDKPTDPGLYTVSANVGATNNYTAYTRSKDFEIYNKATGSGNVIMESWVYGETPKNPTWLSNTNSGATPTYSYTGTNETSYGPSETLPSEPGDYLLTATMGETENYGSYQSRAIFEIRKQTGQGTLTMESWIQGEPPKDPHLNSTNDMTDAVVTYTYSGTLKDGTDYANTTEKPTEPGDYQVIAAVSGRYFTAYTTNSASFSISSMPEGVDYYVMLPSNIMFTSAETEADMTIKLVSNSGVPGVLGGPLPDDINVTISATSKNQSTLVDETTSSSSLVGEYFVTWTGDYAVDSGGTLDASNHTNIDIADFKFATGTNEGAVNTLELKGTATLTNSAELEKEKKGTKFTDTITFNIDYHVKPTSNESDVDLNSAAPKSDDPMSEATENDDVREPNQSSGNQTQDLKPTDGQKENNSSTEETTGSEIENPINQDKVTDANQSSGNQTQDLNPADGQKENNSSTEETTGSEIENPINENKVTDANQSSENQTQDLNQAVDQTLNPADGRKEDVLSAEETSESEIEKSNQSR